MSVCAKGNHKARRRDRRTDISYVKHKDRVQQA
jgi:hypothetical protein